MFASDLARIAQRISAVLAELEVPDPGEIRWQPAPFAGEWGMGTNVAFQAAAAFNADGSSLSGELGSEAPIAPLNSAIVTSGGCERSESERKTEEHSKDEKSRTESRSTKS